jgi:hypothetical protein
MRAEAALSRAGRAYHIVRDRERRFAPVLADRFLQQRAGTMEDTCSYDKVTSKSLPGPPMTY